MNGFDQAIFDALGRFAAHHAYFNYFVDQWVRAEMVGKGDIAMALFWGLWFVRREPVRDRREILIATVAAGVIGVAAGRGIGMAFPFRMRPIHDHSLNLHLPFPEHETGLRDWSSFPSDHAMVWSAVAVGVGTIVPWAGWVIGFLTLFTIGLPRVYLGLHYPTDVLAAEELRSLLGTGVCLNVVDIAALESAFARLYGERVLAD